MSVSTESSHPSERDMLVDQDGNEQVDSMELDDVHDATWLDSKRLFPPGNSSMLIDQPHRTSAAAFLALSNAHPSEVDHNSLLLKSSVESIDAGNSSISKRNSSWSPFNDVPQNGLVGVDIGTERGTSSTALTDESSIARGEEGQNSKVSKKSSQTSVEPQTEPGVQSENRLFDTNSDINDPLTKKVKVEDDTFEEVSRKMGAKSAAPKRKRFSSDPDFGVMDYKPKTAIPGDISPRELARQSIEAALSSRLNPFALHPDEYKMLREHICHLHVSAYLNVRNRILRLWVRNPLVTVSAEEAAGCTYGARWLGLAQVAYEWLLRRGYINFGCLEIPASDERSTRGKHKRKTVAVVGAGMSGLGCARQLEGLFSHYRHRWVMQDEEPPRVVVLEGRPRIGGRIYSHPLKNQDSRKVPRNARCTAEMGAHIITGFDHGNPLNMIIRGQLALHYHPLRDTSTLYDIDGKMVNRERDVLVEKLFNDILDRASVFRHKQSAPTTVEGNRILVESGKDPAAEVGELISVVEADRNEVINQPASLDDQGLDQVPTGVDKLTGKAFIAPGSKSKVPAARALLKMGWTLKDGVSHDADISLDEIASADLHPSLGDAMDEAVKQFQSFLDLSAQDLRLLNWHYANLEYANAANVGKLSLGGWDQDVGNEFEGEHAQVIGGYIQVPYGILQTPFPLDLRTRKEVVAVRYSPEGSQPNTATITCSDGDLIEAHRVVLTTPLGVLKRNSVLFEPELPPWKLDSIHKLGFGVLNKVILAYERPFWDEAQDMIGLLRESDMPGSLDQEDYSKNRGRFYFFWNCIKTVGRPVLIALMAGDAAHQVEHMQDGQVVAEVTHQLAKMFRHKQIPHPTETIITRWGQDKYARGTYSYVGTSAHSDDYDLMAKSIGNLHFAGEATCGTHPATVHGAYISGLRAASEVVDSLLGPIEIPSPLVPEAPIKQEDTNPKLRSVSNSNSQPEPTQESAEAKQARLEAFERDILKEIFSKLGPRPDKPEKAGARNPFLLFSTEKWAECKAECDARHREKTGSADAKASRNEIRAELGQRWRDAPDEVKRPYIQQTVENKAAKQESVATFNDRLAKWDADAIETRKEFIRQHPGVLSKAEEQNMWQALGVYAGGERRAKVRSGYAGAEVRDEGRGGLGGDESDDHEAEDGPEGANS